MKPADGVGRGAHLVVRRLLLLVGVTCTVVTYSWEGVGERLGKEIDVRAVTASSYNRLLASLPWLPPFCGTRPERVGALLRQDRCSEVVPLSCCFLLGWSLDV